MEGPFPRPRDGKHNAYFFSQYKHRTTLKYLILVSTLGIVVYVSDPYAGHYGDDEILKVEWPNVQKYVPAGSIIFFDKGLDKSKFLDELEASGIMLVIPPKKMPNVAYEPHQTIETALTANQRIVVENVIGRTVAIFPFVKDLPTIFEVDLMGPATRVSFFLTNYLPALTQGRVPVRAARLVRDAGRDQQEFNEDGEPVHNCDVLPGAVAESQCFTSSQQ